MLLDCRRKPRCPGSKHGENMQIPYMKTPNWDLNQGSKTVAKSNSAANCSTAFTNVKLTVFSNLERQYICIWPNSLAFVRLSPISKSPFQSLLWRNLHNILCALSSFNQPNEIKLKHFTQTSWHCLVSSGCFFLLLAVCAKENVTPKIGNSPVKFNLLQAVILNLMFSPSTARLEFWTTLWEQFKVPPNNICVITMA